MRSFLKINFSLKRWDPRNRLLVCVGCVALDASRGLLFNPVFVHSDITFACCPLNVLVLRRNAVENRYQVSSFGCIGCLKQGITDVWSLLGFF